VPAAPRPVLLDVTRLVSRVGGGPLTGIDRVERAVLRVLLVRDAMLHGLCRTADGFALLDRPGLEGLLSRLDGDVPWGRTDVVGHLSLRLPAARRAGESDVRRLACGRARTGGLAALLRGRLPEGTAYVNVGHADLDDAVFDAVRDIPGSVSAVMMHDVIPLRLPWTQRPGAVVPVRAQARRRCAPSRCGLCPSAAEGAHLAAALANGERAPRVMVTPLGIDAIAPGPRTGRPAARALFRRGRDDRTAQEP
jgi:hypothetical protein